MFDINLFPVNLEQGVEQGSLPGLAALTPPRRAARGRENDVVLAMVQFSGTSGNLAESRQAWLVKKLEGYFQIGGTVTFAMKTLVEVLNHELMEENLKRAKDGVRISADLSLAVVKRETLYLVNIGSAKAWVSAKDETAEFSDSDNQGRGLGVDQNLYCRFATRELADNDVLVISCQPPALWGTDTFSGCSKLTNEAVSRRLFNQIGSDLKAAMVRFGTGKGLINQQAFHERPTALPKTEKEAGIGKIQPTITEPVSTPAADWRRPSSLTAEVRQTANPTPNMEMESAESEDHSPALVRKEDTQPVPGLTLRRRGSEQPTKEGIQRPKTPVPSEGSTSSGPTLTQVKAGKVTEKVVTAANGIGSSFSNFMQKVLPGMADESFKMSRSALIGIAIVVPLVIAILAGAVYASSGKSKQFNQHLILAQQYAMQAEVQVNDPPMYLASLQQSMYWLDKAELYGQTDSSTSLRVKVQGELDILQGIQRLEMAEVIAGGLPAGTVVTQMVATATDLYLLDEKSGTISRLTMGSSGYEIDEAFDCGPNPDNPLNTMGKLVDMVPVEVNNTFRATILAMDAAGNTEFCIPAAAGVMSGLTPPDQGWKNLNSISIYGSYLYILDSGGNAVYRYEGSGTQYESKPTLFFDNQIPALTEAIDIEVNGDELYILRSNGEMVECTYSHMKDYKLTECTDPAPYGDMRTGQEPTAVNFPEAEFIQMRLTSAPDSSIYLLDATTKALYHFSLQRNLQKILHPRFLDGVNLDRVSPSAITISSGRIVFIAFGSQIYYAPLP